MWWSCEWPGKKNQNPRAHMASLLAHMLYSNKTASFFRGSLLLTLILGLKVLGLIDWNMPKLLRKSSEKLRANSMVKIAGLNDAFTEVFEVVVSPVEGQSLQQKDKKRRKRKSKNFDFCECGCLSKNVANRNVSGKKGMLSCFKCLLNRLELIWPISRLKISKGQKMHF